MNKAELVSFLTTNCKCWHGKQQVLEQMDEESLGRLRQQYIDARTLAANAERKQQRKQQKLAANSQGDGKTLTFNEWLGQMPAEGREMWEDMQESTRHEREQLLSVITNSLGRNDQHKQQIRKIHENMKVKDLRVIANGLQTADSGPYTLHDRFTGAAGSSPRPFTPSFGGQGGVVNHGGVGEEEGPLEELPIVRLLDGYDPAENGHKPVSSQR